MRNFFKRKKQTGQMQHENKIKVEMKHENENQNISCIKYSSQEANEKGFFFRINGRNCKIMRYKGGEEFPIIPDYINGKPVRTIGSQVFAGQHIKGIRFPEKLRVIKEKAFYKTELEAIELPETIEEIGAEAFGNCRVLRSVTIKGKTKQKELDISGNAFHETPYITASKFIQLRDILLRINPGISDHTITIPSGVRVINYEAMMWRGGGMIRRIEIPATVKIIKDRAFEDIRYCKTIALEQPMHFLQLGEDVFGKIRYGWNSFSWEIVKEQITSMNPEGSGWVTFKKLSIHTSGFQPRDFTIYVPYSKRRQFWGAIQFAYYYNYNYNEQDREIVPCIDMKKYCEIFNSCDSLKDQLKMAKFIILNYGGAKDYRKDMIQFVEEHINKAVQYAVMNNEKDTLMMYRKLELLEKGKLNDRHARYLIGKYENEAADYLKEVMKAWTWWGVKPKYRSED